MSGHTYGDHEPTQKCPYCGYECRADYVDIGVGMQQCGPFACDNCHASQIGPYDEPRQLSAEEIKIGWYAPLSQPGSTANVINGRVVSHVIARATYQKEFKGNPLWHDQEYVKRWWDKHRKTK
jgi:hypothetical protein